MNQDEVDNRIKNDIYKNFITAEDSTPMEQDPEITVIRTGSENEGSGEPNTMPDAVSEEIIEDTENSNPETEDGGTDKVFPVSFPVSDLSRLDEMISNPRWVVPVLPGGQLEILLESAINLCKKGMF